MELRRFLVGFPLVSVWGILLLLSESARANDESSGENNFDKFFQSLELDETPKPIFNHFGSLHTLEKLTFWAAKEQEIVSVLRNRLSQLRHLLHLTKQFIQSYKDSSMIILSEAKKSHARILAANIFMITRYSSYIQNLRRFMESHIFQDTKKNLLIVLSTESVWPNKQDLYVSKTALLHLQEIQGFHPKELYKETTIDTKHGGKLGSMHCADIGVFALQQHFYYMGIEWLELAKNLSSSQTNKNEVDAYLVNSLLEMAVEKHNRVIQEGRSFAEELLDTFVNLTYAGEPSDSRLSGRNQFYSMYAGTVLEGYYGGYPNLLGLCSGEEYQPKEIKKGLKCYLERSLHPYLLLNPVKTELLSEEPYISQMYDVLGNESIRELYENRGEMHLSTLTTISNWKETLLLRTSSGSLLDSGSNFARRINKKSEIITGLKISEEDEPIQVVEYIYGRYCALHNDTNVRNELYRSKLDEKLGYRVASLLYYVEEPRLGGSTPFSHVGIAAEPRRGSAVFWINLHKNGSVRGDVAHAACPVLHGNKIALNRWIRYDPNYQTFKCSLNQLD